MSTARCRAQAYVPRSSQPENRRDGVAADFGGVEHLGVLGRVASGIGGDRAVGLRGGVPRLAAWSLECQFARRVRDCGGVDAGSAPKRPRWDEIGLSVILGERHAAGRSLRILDPVATRISLVSGGGKSPCSTTPGVCESRAASWSGSSTGPR